MFKLNPVWRFPLRASAASLFLSALASSILGQQITCPVLISTTNSSATATNSVDPCQIFATFTFINESGASLENKAGAVLINDGIFQNSGTLLNDAGASFTNDAQFNNNAGATVSNSGTFNGSGFIDNLGTFNNGSGTLNNVVLNSAGTINNGAGSVYLAAGSDIEGGTLNSGTGGITFGNNVTLDGSTIGALTIQGSVGSDPAISTMGHLQGTINNQGTLALGSASSAYLNMSGNTTLQGGGTITLANGFITNLTVTTNLTNVNNTIQGYGGVTPVGFFDNQGTVNANVSGKTLQLLGFPISNTGVIEATGGGQLTIVTGLFNNNSAGSVVVGAGSAILNETVFNNNAGASFNNAGIFTNSPNSSGAFFTNNVGATFTNSGVFDGTGMIKNYATLTNAGTGTLSQVIDNFGGTISNGAGNVILGAGSVIQGGTLNAGTGAISFGNNVTFDGSTAYGAVTIQGTLSGNPNLASPALMQGTINNEGTISLIAPSSSNGYLVLNGATTLQGGGTVVLSNSFITEFAVVATFTNVDNTIQGDGGITPVGAFLNGGTVNANVSGQTLRIQGFPTTNTGLMEATGGGVLEFDYVGGVSNASSGSVVAGAGSTITNGGPFTNAGSVVIQSGATWNNANFSTGPTPTSTYVQTAGQTVVDGTMNSLPAVQIQGGVLSGTGTIVGAVVNSGGIVQPGDAGIPGTLVVESYEQESGATFDELISASGYGALGAVFGGIDLDSGSLLDITLLNGFTPTDGETFDIMGAVLISGTFANAPAAGFQMDGFNWTITYNPGDIILEAGTAVNGGGGGGTTSTPEPSTLGLLAAGFFAMASRLRAKRTAGQ
jgi:fibronectin-binding autotransporter adhesin